MHVNWAPALLAWSMACEGVGNGSVDGEATPPAGTGGNWNELDEGEGEAMPDPAAGRADEDGLEQGACGDGELNSGEMCDDGNTIETDGCRSDCRIPGGLLSERFTRVEGGISTAGAFAALEDGSFLVAGGSNGGVWLGRYSVTGDLLEENSFAFPSFIPNTLIPDGEGGLYVHGFVTSGRGTWLARINADREVLWEVSEFGAPWRFNPRGLARNPAGNLVAVGMFQSDVDGSRVGGVQGYSPNGELLFEHGAGYYDEFASINDAVYYDTGEIVLVGSGRRDENGEATAAQVVRVDAAGARLWQRSLDSAGVPALGPDSLTPVQGGGTVMCSLLVSPEDRTDVATLVVHHDDAGNELSRFITQDGLDVQCEHVWLDDDGGAVLVDDAGTAWRINADGSVSWQVYRQAQRFVGLAPAPNGEVFFAGVSMRSPIVQNVFWSSVWVGTLVR